MTLERLIQLAKSKEVSEPLIFASKEIASAIVSEASGSALAIDVFLSEINTAYLLKDGSLGYITNAAVQPDIAHARAACFLANYLSKLDLLSAWQLRSVPRPDQGDDPFAILRKVVNAGIDEPEAVSIMEAIEMIFAKYSSQNDDFHALISCVLDTMSDVEKSEK